MIIRSITDYVHVYISISLYVAIYNLANCCVHVCVRMFVEKLLLYLSSQSHYSTCLSFNYDLSMRCVAI